MLNLPNYNQILQGRNKFIIQIQMQEIQNKKGIRIKTKQSSFVDNIVNFFKKDNVNSLDRIENATSQDLRDTSPRSTTPRKKIFDKTPQKAGRININLPNNNRSVGNAYELTFNQQSNPFSQAQPRSNLSPKRGIQSRSNPVYDTQFNKLILQNSINNTSKQANTHPRAPQKTFIGGQQPSPSHQNKTENHLYSNQSIPAPDRLHPTSTLSSQVMKKMQKELHSQKKQIQQMRRENFQLKKQNKDFYQEIQSLQKRIKTYELSTRHNQTKVQTVFLQTPKSPFDKVRNEEQPQKETNFFSRNEQKVDKNPFANKKNLLMKQSIPIMPQIAHQFGQRHQQPKMQQMSLMSVNLRNISQQGSFLCQQASFQKSVQNLMSKQNRGQKNVAAVNNQNIQLLSPLMQKTVYQKRVKVQGRQKQMRKEQGLQQGEQITFSKTIGYLKGDQPKIQLGQRQMIKSDNKNPFQQIATNSNKFYFKEDRTSQISLSNNKNSIPVIEGNRLTNNHKTKQWLNFTDDPSLQYSDNTESNRGDNSFDKGHKNILRKQVQKKSNVNKQQRSPQNSVTKKMVIEESRTYKFADFDPNQQSSNADFF